MNVIRRWLNDLPKVELHLHLEGAIPLETLWQLMQKYGGDPEVRDLAALKQRFIYRDFSHFIRTWVWKNKFLREYEDFTFIAEAVARDLANQNVKYVESFISPPDFQRHGLETGGIVEAIRKGLDTVPEIRVNLVVDLVRDYGPERAAATLRDVQGVMGSGVVGIGIGGSEAEFPPEQFASVYEQARNAGLRTSAHAGEAAGAASIWGALRDLKADRIGHATRATEDVVLLEQLIEKRIPLEMCPLSNLRTGVVPSIAKHPIRSFFDKGALVTVSTDDPQMFNNSLADEFSALIEEHDFTAVEIRTLVLNGIEASWLTDAEKVKLKESFQADPAWMVSEQ